MNPLSPAPQQMSKEELSERQSQDLGRLERLLANEDFVWWRDTLGAHVKKEQVAALNEDLADAESRRARSRYHMAREIHRSPESLARTLRAHLTAAPRAGEPPTGPERPVRVSAPSADAL